MKRLLAFVIVMMLVAGCATEETSSTTNVTTVEGSGNFSANDNNGAVEEDTSGEEEGNEDAKDNEEGSGETKSDDANYIPAHVTRVVDGDTLVATINGEEERVRLVLVDTPETVHPSKPVQPFGPEASDLAKETLEGQEVELELDVSERDQYGRVLAYVWIGDKMFNEMLLEKGLARVSVFPPDVKYVDRFREVEKKAQEKGIGIWSIEDYATEDGYNETSQEPSNSAATNVSENCSDPKIKGNINSSGEKIYHVPGGQYYEVTNPEELFCTEEEAQSAGFRKSKR